MSHLIYRVSDTNPNRAASSISIDPLTSEQIDGNFKVLNDDLALRATIASPSLTGVPLVPTAAVNTNTAQIASTAFVVAQIADDAPNKSGSTATPGSNWPINITGNSITSTTAANCIGNSETATLAVTASKVTTVNDASSADQVYPLWTANIGASYAIKASATKLFFVPSTGTLTSTNISATSGSLSTLNIGATPVINSSRQLINSDISGSAGANTGLKTLQGISLFGSGDINVLRSTYNLPSGSLHSTTLDPGMYTVSGGLPNKNNSGIYLSGWWHVVVFKHGDNNGYAAQIAVELSTSTGRTSNVSYIRTSEGGVGPAATWAEWSPLGQHAVVVTGVSYTALINEHVYCTGAAGTVITLPNSPVVGDRVIVTNLNEGVIVARNGLNIHRLAEDMTLDFSQATTTFCYLDATNGWTVISAL